MAVRFLKAYRGLQIKWDHEMELELIPFLTLESVKNSPQITYAFYKNGDEEYEYHYEVHAKRSGNVVELTYNRNPPQFRDTRYWTIEFGKTEIKFSNEKLEKVQSVKWFPRDKSRKAFEPYFEYKSAPPPEKMKKRSKRQVSVWDRRAQARFKSELFPLDGKCAISGCTFYEVLQAAHIQPVKDGGADSSSNGILLRADLHLLFDAGRIRVDPRSGKIQLSHGARAYLKGNTTNSILNPNTLKRVRKSLLWKTQNHW